jgi:ABC-type Zn uptake system ZnuABC Zn-binding protein ZnuA
MKKLPVLLGILVLLGTGSLAQAQSKLNVVTTTEDLASIAREVGGDRIAVESISRG